MILTRCIIAGAALAAASVLAACSGGQRDIETPAYEVVARLSDDVEIRRYDPRVAAETVAGSSSDAFRRLFDYIRGANAGATSIEMTAPVETLDRGAEIAMTVPVETASAGEGGVSMRFFLPSGYALGAAPEPTNPKVRLVGVEQRTEAVLRYSGLPLDSRAGARKERLLKLLATTQWTPVGSPTTYYYDPPWTLPWDRRNEIAQPVEATGR